MERERERERERESSAEAQLKSIYLKLSVLRCYAQLFYSLQNPDIEWVEPFLKRFLSVKSDFCVIQKLMTAYY